MIAAHEIPADVMAAAREALAAWHNPADAPITLEYALACAILVERQRAISLANDMVVPLAAGRPNAEAHNAACRAISHAIQGPTI